MGYNNAIPGWMMEELLKEQAEKARKRKGIKLTARIVTGSAEYVRELGAHDWRKAIWKLCTETLAQFESEQYLRQKGFKRL